MMYFFFVVFLRENCVTDKSRWRAESASQSNFPQREEQDIHKYILSNPPHFPFSTVCQRKAFKCCVNGYCAAHHLLPPPPSFPTSLVCSMHAITVLIFKKEQKKGVEEGEKGGLEDWKGDERTER